jgi:hypothetical protein
VLRHQLGGLPHGHVRRSGDDFGADEGADGVRVHIQAAGDGVDYDVPVGDDADELAVIEHGQGADVVVAHLLGGLADRGAGVDVLRSGGHHVGQRGSRRRVGRHVAPPLWVGWLGPGQCERAPAVAWLIVPAWPPLKRTG